MEAGLRGSAHRRPVIRGCMLLYNDGECRAQVILVLMMFKLHALVALGVALFSAISRGEGATTVVVNGTPSHAISPLLCE